MRNDVIFSLMVGLIGCGSPDGSNDDAATDKPENVGEESDPDKSATTPDSERPSSLYVLESGALPECGAEREGWLAFVATPGELQACIGGAWTSIQQKAADPVFWSCKGTGDLDPSTEVSVALAAANVVQLPSGDVFMTCIDHYSDSDYLDSDTSTDSDIIPASGPFTCVAYHVSATFDPAKGTLEVTRNGHKDKGASTCKKLGGS